YSRPGNIGKSRSYGFNVNAQIPFAKWLSSNIYSEVNYAEFESQLYTENLNSSGAYWYISVTNQLKLDKNWSAEVSGTYQTKVTSSQFVLGASGNINIGIQKKILKGQGSLKLSGNDIFMGNIHTGTINNLRLTDATWINKPDSRALILAFTYSFGKAFQPKNEYDATGADSEKNRVKG
ncbi:MAG: TonB-dependent receptor, partial [Flavobacterium sp.]